MPSPTTAAATSKKRTPDPSLAESKGAYGLLLIGIYWITEAFPIAVTAMIPIVLFPLMGVASEKKLATAYFSSASFILIGGMGCAIAIEKWNLHRRFALKVLLLIGSDVRRLMLGFMMATGGISMWISNTASAAMMIPIAQAVLVQLIQIRKRDKSLHIHESEESELEIIDNEKEHCDPEDEESATLSIEKDASDRFNFNELDLESKKLCKMISLCICYAASCGGIATLTGSGTNLVMKGHIDRISDGQSGLTFSSWFVFGFPVALLSLLCAWLVLQVFFLGVRQTFCCKKESGFGDVNKILLEEYQRLGPLSFSEKGTIGHFVLLLLLWFFQEPEVFTGWSSIFPKGYIGNGVPSLLVLCSLFIFPNGISKNSDDFMKHGHALLNWNITSAKMPWGTILLLGGGFALATVCETSGLSIWLADQMSVLSTLPLWLMALLVNLIASLATEVTSNVAITTILMPILTDLAIGIHVHPVYLLLPASISTSFAFMLPVATPPNTIVFSYGYLKVFDMVRVGFVLNLICVFIVTMAISTYGRIYFNLDEFPEWAIKTTGILNTTLVINETSPIPQLAI
ncbi:hypothetical protein ACJMK2_011232 [Sinanodonta woodiana]|uniref:Solute carrier family 13 member 2 n=1 Tax=Sinanodonta woodiana TaxID=1069815 RepID=A0ABD3V6Q9_SINWO